MDEVEKSLAVILSKNHDSFSAMARRGFKKSGRGAIFVWESEGKGPFTTFRASYMPVSDAVFQSSGTHPRETAGVYEPGTEFVAVFIGADETVRTLRVDLKPETPPEPTDP
jgi:hypothetical protein